MQASADDGIDFRLRLQELNEQLEKLDSEASALNDRIAANLARLLE
jgi:prefoldin subunit 5